MTTVCNCIELICVIYFLTVQKLLWNLKTKLRRQICLLIFNSVVQEIIKHRHCPHEDDILVKKIDFDLVYKV